MYLLVLIFPGRKQVQQSSHFKHRKGTGEHGTSRYLHGLWHRLGLRHNTSLSFYKRYVHEGGISTPFIAHWPKGIRRSGEIDRQPAHITDIMATCVDIPV